MKKNTNSIFNMVDRMKEMYVPAEAEGVRIATNGNICVETPNGYVTINDFGELETYPVEMTLEFPMYIINKPKEQLVAGDIICHGRSYYKVTKIDGSKIKAIGYQGSSKTIYTMKDIMVNQSMVRVVVSLAGNICGTGINPMLPIAIAMSEKKGGSSMKSLLPFMMMQQNGGMMGMNPMMMALMMKDGDGDDSSMLGNMLMFSAMSGNNNPFGNLFGGNCGCQAAPAQAPTKRPAAARPKKTESKKKELKAAPKKSAAKTEEAGE